MPPDLVTTMLAVGDATLRRSALDARLSLVGFEAFVLELDSTWRRAIRGDARAREASLSVAAWLHARRASPSHCAMRDASEHTGLALARRLLARGATRRELPRRAWSAEQTLARHVAFIRSPLRDPTRRVPPFAREAVRGGGVRIHRGQLPQLLRLLDAPTVSLRTVVDIAAQRPLAPAVASALVDHPRWWAEYVVRAALITNPFSPLELVLPLLPTASRRDLVRLCTQPAPEDALSGAARLVLEVRDATPLTGT